MNTSHRNITIHVFFLLAAVFLSLLGCTKKDAGREITILNLSYDTTRELYQEYNRVFARHYKEKTGITVLVNQSHAGSAGQARSVIEGNEADVLTLSLASVVDTIADAGNIIAPDWITRLPHNSSPYTSAIVFLVRAGNPKNIRDWDDLVKDGVHVVTTDPKTSGLSRWSYLAAWAYARQNYGEDNAREFVKRLFGNVFVFDSGARSSTNTFVQRGLGDVLLAWENEVYLILKEHPEDNFEIVTPSLSILTEPSVTYVDSIVDKHGTRDVATAYLEYLYTDDMQRLIGRHYYRPSNPAILAEFSELFPPLHLVTVDDDFGGWQAAHNLHFADGGIFDQIMTELKR